MTREPDISSTSDQEAKALQKRDMKRFVLVMIAFTIGMAIMLFYEVSAWWIWYLYFIVWTVIEVRIAKNIKLKWWHWVLIVIAILVVDLIVLELVDYLKA
ncbi:MAG: hypothetical protein KJN68_03980 [Bacteroidia bacterium]|nr:hypothetical protein [Bacteroidia bacterium]